jgi:hypothetical protein
MSGAVIAFPEPIYKPDIDKLTDIMTLTDEMPSLLAVEMMIRVARLAMDGEDTRENNQRMVNSLAVAYCTLARLFGHLDLSPEGKPTVG